MAALVIAIAGIAAAATHGSEPNLVASGEEQVTTTSAPPAETTTTTTAVPETTTTSSAVATTTTTTRRTTTTARRVTTATTTASRASTTAVRRPVRTTVALGPPCTPAELEVATRTDKPSYGPGEVGSVTFTVRNRSTVMCSYGGFIVEYTVKDADGEQVYSQRIDATGRIARSLLPGQAFPFAVPWSTANQPAGEYVPTATLTFGGGSLPATVTIHVTK